MIINGTADPINPYNGGNVVLKEQDFREIMSTKQTTDYWVSLLDTHDRETTTATFPGLDKSDDSIASRTIYSDKNNIVEPVRIENGGHVIPNNSSYNWPKELGNINKDIDSPRVIIEFPSSL